MWSLDFIAIVVEAGLACAVFIYWGAVSEWW